MQNAGSATLGLNWRYLALEVRPDDLRAAIRGAQEMTFIGLNLTVPLKLLAVGMVDLVLNATSLGLKAGDPMPFDGKQFSLRQAGAVYDMIYRLAETPLLKTAKAPGCRVANGLGMLLYQGAAALKLWSGQTAPVEIMRRALENKICG